MAGPDPVRLQVCVAIFAVNQIMGVCVIHALRVFDERLTRAGRARARHHGKAGAQCGCGEVTTRFGGEAVRARPGKKAKPSAGEVRVYAEAWPRHIPDRRSDGRARPGCTAARSGWCTGKVVCVQNKC